MSLFLINILGFLIILIIIVGFIFGMVALANRLVVEDEGKKRRNLLWFGLTGTAFIWFISNLFLFDRWSLPSEMVNIFNIDSLVDISLEMVEATGVFIGFAMMILFFIMWIVVEKEKKQRCKRFVIIGLGIVGIGFLAYAFNVVVFGVIMRIDSIMLTDWMTPPERVVFDPRYDKDYKSLEETRINELGLNTDSATTWVRYRNREHGIAFDLPYNLNWGNETFSITPYWNFHDEYRNEEIQFGPMVNLGSPCGPEGCMRLRSTMLTVLPLEGDQETLSLKEIEEYFKKHVELYGNVKSMELNGISMIKYTLLRSADCHNPTIAIIGEEEYDYRLKTLGCSANIEQDFEYLEGIAESFRLF